MKNFALALVFAALLLVFPASFAMVKNAGMGLYAMGVGMVYSALVASFVSCAPSDQCNVVGAGVAFTFVVPLLGLLLWTFTR